MSAGESAGGLRGECGSRRRCCTGRGGRAAVLAGPGLPGDPVPWRVARPRGWPCGEATAATGGSEKRGTGAAAASGAVLLLLPPSRRGLKLCCALPF